MSEEQEGKERKKTKEGLLTYLERWWGELPIRVKLCLFIGTFVALIITWFFCPDFAKFIGYMIGGGLLTLQILAYNRRATAAEKTAELTERGNIAERFKIAIEHLGRESASIRLGGIYTLHHIAHEAEEYRERVFEILCAHIRETTTQEKYKPSIRKSGWEQPTIEIQSILELLFINPPEPEIYKGFKANLDYTHLVGARLIEAKLDNAYFSFANLQKATLLRASFQNTSLYRTDLQEADLIDAENLEVEQLLYAETLYQAVLPDEMENEIKKQNPKLLEKPSDE